MSVITHDVDPNGDLVVVLKKPNTKNVIPEVSLRQETKLGQNAPTFAPDTTDVRTPSMPSGLPNNAAIAGESDEIRFRVSSAHLKLASVQFRGMLSPPWTESQAVNTQSDYTDSGTEDLSPSSSPAAGTGSPGSPVTSSTGPSPSSPSVSQTPRMWEVTVTEWHAHALLTVFNIIHSKGSSIPRNVSMEFFTQVALIADYYHCAEALSFVAATWYSSFEKHARKYGKEVIMWLVIALVFSWDFVFHMAAYTVVHGGEGLSRVTIHDLPFLEILEELNKKRTRAIFELRQKLRTVDRELRKGEIGCDNTCRSMMVGSLVIEKETNRDLITTTCINHNAVSLSKVITAIKEFAPTVWHDSTGCAHACSAAKLMLPSIKQVKDEIATITLSDFQHNKDGSSTKGA
ncbi:hypothetical protein FPOAC2_00299 [Fusarium poae]